MPECQEDAMTAHKLCPLKMPNPAMSDEPYCDRDLCAWWTVDHEIDDDGVELIERCAIVTMANSALVEMSFAEIE